jgi:uncharacterized protein YjbJ (UPF0337 family)
MHAASVARGVVAAIAVGTLFAMNKMSMSNMIRLLFAIIGPIFSGRAMNWDRVQGNWKQLKGSVREKWARLTDDHSNAIDGRRENLAGKLQEAYGIGKEEADRQMIDWQRTIQEVANDNDSGARIVNSRR